ncbi:hypothetical protein VTJ04DRAFT_2213 [Mycothermus thermophilus]|uniref:uncharacterized protein n=1 Tax=Humicola insolens TaxID=85995 RepID=UPI003742223C
MLITNNFTNRGKRPRGQSDEEKEYDSSNQSLPRRISSEPAMIYGDADAVQLTPEIICYGALLGAMASVLSGAHLPSSIRDGDERYTTFHLRAFNSCFVLDSANCSQFAVLDNDTTAKLSALHDLDSVRFEGVVDRSEITKRRTKSTTKIQVFPLSVNILGPESLSKEVARLLGAASGYLQHPMTVPRGVKYQNPQFFRFKGDDVNMDDFVGTVGNVSSAVTEYARIMESLGEVSFDNDFELPPCNGLTTPLKRHQEDGVRFIISREPDSILGSCPSNLGSQPIRDREPFKGPRGGIIADVMGLGKTLTMLATISQTLPHALQVSKFGNLSSGKLSTHGTLVVVPCLEIIESWIAQLEQHFHTGALKALKFHGPNRPFNVESLTSYDVILTTYATLATDIKSSRVLYGCEWYRVVLDEAHWIRNPSSTYYQAVLKLDTSRRWCITGTPVQNRIQDLSSLAGFLQLQPCPTKADFERHILAPLSRDGPDSATPLRDYLKRYCIRRTAKYHTLPPRHDHVMALHLSKQEKDRYDRVLERVRREIEISVSTNKSDENAMMFKVIMRLRKLCNLGTDLVGCGSAEQTFICPSCSVEDESGALRSNSNAFCLDCGRALTKGDDGMGSINLPPSTTSSFSCPAQSPDVRSPPSPWLSIPETRTIASPRRPPSPAAFSYTGSQAPSPGTPTRITASHRRSPSFAASSPIDSQAPSPGVPTKLAAVIGNIRNSDPDAKHIVFSCWTSTIDALSQLLNQENIEHRQIDGRTDGNSRLKWLKEFEQSQSVNVLLMSVGTGSVGLNLAAANYVHMVEPQWNPAVEDQAVARVLRIGQRREVHIYRYIMENTIEKSIVDLQRKKARLAEFTMAAASDRTATFDLEDIKSIIRM